MAIAYLLWQCNIVNKNKTAKSASPCIRICPSVIDVIFECVQCFCVFIVLVAMSHGQQMQREKPSEDFLAQADSSTMEIGGGKCA